MLVVAMIATSPTSGNSLANLFTCSPPRDDDTGVGRLSRASPLAGAGSGGRGWGSSDEVSDLFQVRQLAAELLDLSEREAPVPTEGRQVWEATLLRPTGDSLR